MTTITLKKWQRDKNYFTGYIDGDGAGIWFDGEFTDFLLEDCVGRALEESVNFYYVNFTYSLVIKLPKSEEIK